MWWEPALAVVAGVILMWIGLVGALYLLGRREADRASLRDALRLGPDVVRLVRRLAADRSLPRGVRVRLGLLLVYLLSPIDLVPDVVPVVGYLDDALVVALTLRSVVRVAGQEVLERHWPGSPDGLRLLTRVARVRA